MHTNDSASGPAAALGIRYTGKPVSGWGGLLLAFRYAERQGIRELLSRALPDGRTSPNQIPVVTMALALFATVLTGGRRFAHAERLREDEVVKRFIGAQRLPSAMTLTRYFGGFVRSQVEQLSAVLAEHTRARLSRLAGDVLDLDSTVFERYGAQQGSLKGHNPRSRRDRAGWRRAGRGRRPAGQRRGQRRRTARLDQPTRRRPLPARARRADHGRLPAQRRRQDAQAGNARHLAANQRRRPLTSPAP